METSNVLADMSSFDFNAPIKVALIFEESDEENKYDETGAGYSNATTYTHNQPKAHNIKPIKMRGPNKNTKRKSTKTKGNANGKTRKIDEVAVNNSTLDPDKDVFKSFLLSDDKSHQDNVSFKNTQQINSENVTKNKQLYEISKYLICIILDYRKYVQTVRETADQEKLTLSKSEFINNKNVFFNRSYNTVKTVMFPQLNVVFLQNFCSITCRLAKDNQLDIKYEEINCLCEELIKWTKEQRNHINFNYIDNSINKKGKRPSSEPHNLGDPQLFTQRKANSTIVQEIVLNHSTNQNVGEKQTSNVCLFTAGPKGQQMSITYKPPDASVKQTQLQSMQMPAQNNSLTFYNYKSLANYFSRLPQISSLNHKDETQHNNFRKSMTYNQTQNIQQDACAYPSPYNMSELHFSPAAVQSNINNKVQRLQQRQVINNIPQISPTSEEIRKRPSLEVIEPLRSCVSTDSGIMSPLNFIEEMPNNIQATPTISHVTSLSPHAVYRPESQCCVCYMITKNMCLGCYSRYYCSNVCQEVDWSSHKHFCKERAALRSEKILNAAQKP